VVSTEIADIFRSNSLKNGLVPIVVDEASHALLLDNPGSAVTVNIATSTISLPDGSTTNYPIDEFARHCLLEGVDQLGFLQKHTNDIQLFEETRSWTP
jgi:3-isopropylmalate/(R)-2-methylmalate dehydratase small subunit